LVIDFKEKFSLPSLSPANLKNLAIKIRDDEATALSLVGRSFSFNPDEVPECDEKCRI